MSETQTVKGKEKVKVKEQVGGKNSPTYRRGDFESSDLYTYNCC